MKPGATERANGSESKVCQFCPTAGLTRPKRPGGVGPPGQIVLVLGDEGPHLTVESCGRPRSPKLFGPETVGPLPMHRNGHSVLVIPTLQSMAASLEGSVWMQ